MSNTNEGQYRDLVDGDVTQIGDEAYTWVSEGVLGWLVIDERGFWPETYHSDGMVRMRRPIR